MTTRPIRTRDEPYWASELEATFSLLGARHLGPADLKAVFDVVYAHTRTHYSAAVEAVWATNDRAALFRLVVESYLNDEPNAPLAPLLQDFLVGASNAAPLPPLRGIGITVQLPVASGPGQAIHITNQDSQRSQIIEGVKAPFGILSPGESTTFQCVTDPTTGDLHWMSVSKTSIKPT